MLDNFAQSRKNIVDILVCGAAKSGTQTLIQTLEQTGCIDTPKILGEPNFFTLNYGKGVDWYNSLFESPEKVLRAEASPTYLTVGHEFLERALSHNPDIKCIFMLRNPVNRAWAQYWANVRKGNEPLSPIEAFDAEQERIGRSQRNLFKFGYQARSRLYEQLLPFFEGLKPSQRHIIVLENYRDNPEFENKRLHQFLDLPTSIEIPLKLAKRGANSGGLPRFQKFHHVISRQKSRFWHFELTRTLWKKLNYWNLTKWGKPYPKIDDNCHEYLSNALSDDRKNLIELMKWHKDPWQDD